MAELAESPQGNPLSSDHELFQMYTNALDTVLGAADVRRSFDEFGLSAGILRLRMIHEAQRVLRTAAREFAAYENAVTNELSARAADPTMTSPGSRWKVAGRLRVPTPRLVSMDLGKDFFSGANGVACPFVTRSIAHLTKSFVWNR